MIPPFRIDRCVFNPVCVCESRLRGVGEGIREREKEEEIDTRGEYWLEKA